MEDKRTMVEKILAGEAKAGDYDLIADFDHNEVRTLLDAHIIEPRQLPEILASDMVIAGMLDYGEYPFRNFSAYEQLRQLNSSAVSWDEFLSEINMDDFTHDDMDELQRHIMAAKAERVAVPRKEFIPRGALEEAIMKQQNARIIQLIVEGYKLLRPDILAEKKFSFLPLRTAAAVFFCGMNFFRRKNAMQFLRLEYPESEVIDVLEKIEKIHQENPGADEAELLQRIMDGNDREVCRLIEKEEICLRNNMTPENMTNLCYALKKLNPYTSVLIFAEGIHYAAAAVLLKFLLKACEDGNRLNGMDYRERLMYANLLIHVLQEEITPEDDDLIEQDWFPMGNSIQEGCDRQVYCHSYSYCFDPQHLYEPRYAEIREEKKKGK